MPLSYSIRAPNTVQQVVDVLRASTLAERCPIEDLEFLRGMIENSELLVGAWSGELRVAKATSAYYPHLGYMEHPECWILARAHNGNLASRDGKEVSL